MDQKLFTTYTARAKSKEVLMTFRYDLEGNIREFILETGTLTKEQQEWLFNTGRFPVTEAIMKGFWMTKGKKRFDITVGRPDLSFDTFWQAYNHKVKKQASEKAWERLSKKNKIEALKAIKAYTDYVWRRKIAKAHAATYLNQRYWEDDFKSIR